MSNNKDFKVKNGIQPTSYFEGLGTVTSGSEGYYLAGASYDSVSFSVASQEAGPAGLAFSNDGTKMYIVGSGSSAVHQYSLSTGFDLSTSSYDSVSLSVSSQDTVPVSLTFNTNGTKMYVAGATNDNVYQYSLSTAFDLSTASYDSVSFSISGQDTSPQGVTFNNDGTKMYLIGLSSDSVFQYTLSTGFDLSTASYDSVSFSVASQETSPREVVFNGDGTKMYMCGSSSDSVHEYTLSTAFDLSTASYDSVSFSVSSQAAVPAAIAFSADGTKMYVSDTSTDSIYQYSTVLTTNTLDLSTGSVFEITPTSDIQVALSNPADSGTVSGATLLLDGVVTNTYDVANAVYDGLTFDSSGSTAATATNLFFKPDGTKMYLSSGSASIIYQYTLSTAWDISTTSYDSVSVDVSSQSPNTLDVCFKPDGTKMYILDGVDTVDEYDLSTAWDISTSSFNQTFSVSAQEGLPEGVTFKPDGTKMYIVGRNGDEVNEYDLSTAWDISTSSFNQLFSVAAQDSSPEAIDFKPDGTKMYVYGLANRLLYLYTLSTAWDISTASYDNVSLAFNPVPEMTIVSTPFGKDGEKFYLLANSIIHQYSTGFPATITYDTAIEWSGGTAPTSPAIGETDVLAFNTRDGGTTYSGVLAIDGAS